MTAFMQIKSPNPADPPATKPHSSTGYDTSQLQKTPPSEVNNYRKGLLDFSLPMVVEGP